MNKVKVAKAPVNSTYVNYDDHTREKFIDKMIEDPVKRGRVAAVARQFGIAPSTATRWWKQYNKTGELSYEGKPQDHGSSTYITDGYFDEYGFKIVKDGFYSKITETVWSFYPHKDPRPDALPTELYSLKDQKIK
ncbi:hypothetical protein INT48_003791 [Thamnidium elegans]|uniref:Insertion element IS150 protein InsJ-like helix-turn-helix domain-containing protein n=1 Tax=Thamnidium elegans TaxID=101142 RepID=A0A8H7SXQ9_9FUNG|nr:hypothetical protein INT48_003791 [Thamnidium elegans]